MRSLGAVLRAIVLLLTLVYWASRALRVLVRLVERAMDPSAGPPDDLAEALNDAALDTMADALAEVPPVEVDPATDEVVRASSWGRHVG